MKNEAIILIGFVLLTYFRLARLHPSPETHPIDGEATPDEGSRRKAISSFNLKSASQRKQPEIGKENMPKDSLTINYAENEKSFDNGALHAGPFRGRRSLGGHGHPVKFQSSQPSAELQTIMSGNWHSMDPESLFRLLNSMSASSKDKGIAASSETPYNYYDEDEDDEPPPIDLVYSGKKPLELHVPRFTKPVESTTITHLTQPSPITLMSSTIGKGYGLDVYNEPEAMQIYRLVKKSQWSDHPLIFFNKRSHARRNWHLENNLEDHYPYFSYTSGMKDLFQLPNGEIAFTPHGMHVFRHHQPVPLQMDNGLPVIRRPVL